MNARIAICAGGVLLCAAGSAMVIGPRPLAGQTDYDVPPPVYTPNDPAPRAVRPVQYTAPAQSQAAPQQESETTRQLRLLYAKDGKEMPEMNIQKMPMVKHSPGTQQLRPVDPNSASTSRFGFLGRLFSLGRETTPPPTYTPPRYNQPAARAPYVPQQQQQQQPPFTQQPAAVRNFPAPRQASAPQPVNTVPAVTASPARNVAAPKKAAEDDIPVLIDDRRDTDSAAANTDSAAPKTAATPAPAAVSAQPQSRGTALNPFPNSSSSSSAANSNSPRLPAADSNDPGPFTGKSLDDSDDAPKTKTDAPTTIPAAKLLPTKTAAAPPTRLEIKSHQQLQSEHLHQPHPLAAPKTLGTAAAGSQADSSLPSSREEKMRRIVARRGLTGFRGFCPVVLRDERELVDAKLQFQSSYRKQTYYFSSATAKATFDLAPGKYAPASAGIDVVLFNDDLKQTHGSLEHAVWFRGHLYFFTSAETLRKFVTDPKSYAIPE